MNDGRKKVIFFDIDGTLIDSNGKMPESARNALIKVRENGHRIVVCTGRSGYQIIPEISDFFTDVISSSGAFVSSDGKVIFDYFVPRDVTKRVQEIIEGTGGILQSQTETEAVMTSRGFKHMNGVFNAKDPSGRLSKIILGETVVTEDISECERIRKFVFYGCPLTLSELNEKLGDVCYVDMLSFNSGASGCGEISGNGINKSLGIQKYIEANDICREDTIAFGDGPNDVDMLEYAGLGVAMGNAAEFVKQRADFITRSIDEDGIEYALEYLKLI